MWNVLIAPLGTVRFRDFFFAAILNSVSVVILDFALIFTYFIDGNWENRQPVDRNKPEILTYRAIIVFFPYWWRMI